MFVLLCCILVLSVSVSMIERLNLGSSVILSHLCAYVCMMYDSCTCVCTYVRTHAHAHAHTHIHTTCMHIKHTAHIDSFEMLCAHAKRVEVSNSYLAGKMLVASDVHLR